MRIAKGGKPSKQLPSRAALNELDRTARTINDYAKRSPIKPLEKLPNFLDKRFTGAG